MGGSDVASVREQSNLSNIMLSLSQQTTSAMSSLPRAWLSDHEAAVQSSGLSAVSQHQLTASGRQMSTVRQPVSSVMTRQQSVMPSSCHSETAAVPPLSRSQSMTALSTDSSPTCSACRHTSGQHTSTACQVELKRAETSAVESSRAGLVRLRSSAALEMGNVHLRDLLSQDDDDADNDDNAAELSIKSRISHESPQEPQSTSCDDPPDSSTGSIHSGVSILKQLLADSDGEDQNEVSTCQPETTDTGTESHILLKVCCQPDIYAL